MSIVATEPGIQLHKIKELNSVMIECDAKQKFVENKGELIGLVAIFRHGDRAPLSISGDIWKMKICVRCEGVCSEEPCAKGMLTKKGYAQAKGLGNYIRRHYLGRFEKLNNIVGYHSGYERSISTLNGVMLGMGKSTYQSKLETSMVDIKNARLVRNLYLSSKLKTNSEKSSNNYILYDEVVVNYCTKTTFRCGKFACDPKKILALVKDQKSEFVAYTQAIKANLITMGLMLGNFGMFLRKEMFKRQAVTLVSGHDSVIIKILNGLNIDIKKFPPYTSTVFLEIWRDYSQNEFVRVVYDGEVQKLGLYRETLISFDNFIKYLDMFNNVNKTLRSIIGPDIKKIQTSEEVQSAARFVLEAYRPLVDTIQKNVKSFNPSKSQKLLSLGQ